MFKSNFNPIIVLFLTSHLHQNPLYLKYFNPIIVLFLTEPSQRQPVRNKNFNPIIVLFLTLVKIISAKYGFPFQSYYSLIFNSKC